MNRPLYETADDRLNERKIAEKIERRGRCILVKLPMCYIIDFGAMRDNKFIAWLEVKQRYRAFGKYANCFFSLLKLMRARELNAATGLPCLFVVQFDDALVYANVLKSNGELQWCGRDDRNDAQDMEPVLAIPNDEFTILERTVDESTERRAARSQTASA